MEHFSHEHPLIIRNEVPKLEGEGGYWRPCNGCGYQIVSGSFYCCEQCPFFNLHKLCAELPHEMKHPWHPEHPLTLDKVPLNYSCKACNLNRLGSLVYQCEPCKFSLHFGCASLMLKIKRHFHPHPLIPLLQSASFVCHACGKEHRGMSYKCTSCPFWVHESCASMPTRITHRDHHHDLTLADILERFESQFFCGICQKDMPMNPICLKETAMDWFYQCVECRFYAHLSCATSKKDTDEETRNEDVLDPNVILLPVPNESIHLITSFIERTHHWEVIKMEKQLNHLGHHHTLILFDEQIKDELFFGSKDNLCEACVKPVLTPFYGCTPCRYFLHKCCAELPTQIQHPFHPEHPLDLLIKAPEDFGLFWCECCNKRCNGFSFKCAECQYVYLDVKCGSLSGPIKHESHKHVLTPKIMSYYHGCNACVTGLLLGSHLVFNCDICEFILHSKCAMLPTSLKRRYDKHPFILTYSPIKGHPNEYYCEICEKEIDPRLWFYHSVECDHSIHPWCICNQDQYSNVKFGAYFKVEGHQHPLTFIQFSNEYGSLCNHCGKRLHEYLSLHPGFECRPCEFKLHLECARDAAKKE